jgi:hypothetical protein
MGPTSMAKAVVATLVTAAYLSFPVIVLQSAPVWDSESPSKGFPMQRRHCGSRLKVGLFGLSDSAEKEPADLRSHC